MNVHTVYFCESPAFILLCWLDRRGTIVRLLIER